MSVLFLAAVLILLCVAGAELTRAACRRQLAPIVVRSSDAQRFEADA